MFSAFLLFFLKQCVHCLLDNLQIHEKWSNWWFLMGFDGFWVLSNTDRTWFSMIFIKQWKFWVFHKNLIRLPFDRSPKSSENSHSRCCEICHWQQDVSDEPKRRIRRKLRKLSEFVFQTVSAKSFRSLISAYTIRRMLRLYEFVCENCFWAVVLYMVQNNV